MKPNENPTRIGVISRDEVHVLLARRLRNATPIDKVLAMRVAAFLLDSKMVTVYTMFYEDPEKPGPGASK